MTLRVSASLVFALVAATNAAPPRGVAATLTSDQVALVDRAVAAELARDHTPGAAIAIARGGTLLYAHGYGLRDVASNAPVDAGTVFEIGSVTKQFTAACVLQLVGAGKVRLDAPIARYLDDIPSGSRITVAQLLGQTSGLPNYTELPGFSAVYDKPATPRQILATIVGMPLDFDPGTRYGYSNSNYVVLGMLVEKISGQSYPRYLSAHILAPLHLWDTRYSAAYIDAGDAALPYGPDVMTHALERLRVSNLDWAYAAGALWSTAPDLVRWEDALYSGHVIDAASLAAMTAAGTLANGKSTGYGFGLALSQPYGEREISHTGGLPGYASIDAYFPDEHLEVAALGDATTFDGSAVVRAVLAVLVTSVATKMSAEADATPAPGEDPANAKLAASLLAQAQKGVADRKLFDAKMNAALTADIIAQVSSQLAPLGVPKRAIFLGSGNASGYHTFHYRFVFDVATIDELVALDSDGLIAGWFFKPADGSGAPAGAASAAPSSSATAAPASTANPSGTPVPR